VKFLFIIPLLFINHVSNSQTITTDSLKKFSYFIFGITSQNSIAQGTASFIKYNDEIYLLTAAHVLDGWDYASNTSKGNYPDTFYVRVFTKNNMKPEFIPILTKDIKEKSEKKYFFEKADLLILKIQIPDNCVVNTLEGFIDWANIPTDEPRDVLVFGYPVDNMDNDFGHYMNNINSQEATGTIKQKYSTPVRFFENNAVDTINYVAFYKSGKVDHGYSGSPTFFLYKSDKDNSIIKISFGGVLCIRNEMQRYMTIVRPEIIINKLLKNN
jgi:hypothetical protein